LPSKGKFLVHSTFRPLFKNFYYAFIQFQKLDHAKKVLSEFRFPEFGGMKCRALPFNKQYLGGESKTPN